MKVRTRLDVITLLKSYPERERKIAVLRYEMAHPSAVLPNEQLEAMAFAHEDGTGRPSSHISDKTMYIALNYQEKADRLNAGIKKEIASELLTLEQDQNRLKHYISLLEPRQAEVIQLLYIGRMTQKEVERALSYSAKTIRKLRDEAVDVLASMYKCTSGEE